MTEEAKGQGGYTPILVLALVVGSLLVGSTGYYFGLEAKPRFSITQSPNPLQAPPIKLDNITGQTWLWISPKYSPSVNAPGSWAEITNHTR